MLYDITGSVQPILVKAFFLMVRAESQWVIISSVIRMQFKSCYKYSVPDLMDGLSRVISSIFLKVFTL